MPVLFKPGFLRSRASSARDYPVGELFAQMNLRNRSRSSLTRRRFLQQCSLAGVAFDRTGFRVVISGLPYATELISRTMETDLPTFSLAAVERNFASPVLKIIVYRSLLPRRIQYREAD